MDGYNRDVLLLVYLRSNDDSYRYEEEAKSGQHQKQVEKIIPCSF